MPNMNFVLNIEIKDFFMRYHKLPLITLGLLITMTVANAVVYNNVKLYCAILKKWQAS